MVDCGYELDTRVVGSLPIVNFFCERIGLDESLARFVPCDDRRLRLAPAVALGVVVRNLVVAHRPVYALGEWAAPFEPGLLGLEAGGAALLNDDRVGRMLDRLFDADRASLLTEIVTRAVRVFRIDLTQIHNDSTTVTFSGAYRSAPDAAANMTPRSKPAARIVHGHNKDHRPDLRQLLWVLSVTADGAVPIVHRVVSGNTVDDVTHIPTWEELRSLAGRADFLYVADCKLANREAMDHVDSNGGRFVTIMPRSRREDRWFRDWITRNTPTWTLAARRDGHRRGDPDETWHTFPAPLLSSEGYRIIWVRSSSKTANDANTRTRRIEKATAALDDLAHRLTGPKARVRTRAAVHEAAKQILTDTDTTRHIELIITETRPKTFTQEHRGTAGPNTKFRHTTKPVFVLTWRIRAHTIKTDAASDGCFPLITNDPNMTPAELLAAYKYQPNLERRHHQLKHAQAVAPVFLKDPARIEALLCCHFIALLINALIERQTRNTMKTTNTPTIPIYPEDRNCTAPSAQRILEIFTPITRNHLTQNGHHIQTFHPTLTPLQHQITKLLQLPNTTYQNT